MASLFAHVSLVVFIYGANTDKDIVIYHPLRKHREKQLLVVAVRSLRTNIDTSRRLFAPLMDAV